MVDRLCYVILPITQKSYTNSILNCLVGQTFPNKDASPNKCCNRNFYISLINVEQNNYSLEKII